jgi:hypothetical protein
MEWYCALTGPLLDKDNIVTANKSLQEVLKLLEERILALYKALLLYQIKSVCSFYEHHVVVFLKDLTTLRNWDGDLGSIHNAEKDLLNDWDTFGKVKTEKLLSELIILAGERRSLLGNIDQNIRNFINQQQRMQSENENKECLRDLRVINPQDDMKRIEGEKETLFDDSYKWILEDNKYAAFTNWEESNLPPCRLLCLMGPAGTGKTMLLIGIIRELSDQPAVFAPTLSYFFCQGQGKTDPPLNSATATLRSLIWMLLIQQPHLISHLQADYGYSRGALFTDTNAFVAMSRVFENMLKDARPVYFIVDALDECNQRLDDLIKVISTSLTLSDKVRWLVSSRPEVDVLSKLKNLNISRVVDLNAQSLDGPVNAYITHKLSTLRNGKGYTDVILAEVSDQVRRRAGNIFLWVALVFKKLKKVHGLRAVEIIKVMPPGLPELYDHMIARIENVEVITPQDCKKVLVAISLAYRPLILSELAVLSGLPPEITQTAVEESGSFLTTTEETVSLIHQSAKEYLEKDLKKNDESRLLQPGWIARGHADITERSIDAMSAILKRDIYGLQHYGLESEDRRPPEQNPLAPVQYSCVFWLDHLREAIKASPRNSKELCDRGFEFLKEHCLHWLESLSLLHGLPNGIISVRELLNVVQVCV